MAYTTIAPGQTDADSPLDQTLMDAIRTDLDDLNTRLGAIEAFSDQAIYDDFALSVINGDIWTFGAAGAGTAPAVALPDHVCHMIVGSSATTYSGIFATAKKMAFDLSVDHTIAFEARLKHSSATTAEFLIGFQDQTLTGTRANNIDLSDMIGFVRGTNANTLKFTMAKASTAITAADNLGTFYPNYATVKIVITFSGATKKVQAYTGTTQADYTEVSGSPFTDTAKIPDIALMPWIGLSNNSGGTADLYLDYALYYWLARPLNA